MIVQALQTLLKNLLFPVKVIMGGNELQPVREPLFVTPKVHGNEYSFAESTLLTSAQLHDRTLELAAIIAKDYKDLVSQENPLVLASVLTGSFIFVADLSRALASLGIPVRTEFLRVSSYSGSQSTGEIKFSSDFSSSVAGQHVLLCEDIIDTARTISAVKEHVKRKSPASVRIVAILDKPVSHIVECKGDYIGFQCPPVFVVGYGLDYNQRYRCYPNIVVLKREIYSKEEEL